MVLKSCVYPRVRAILSWRVWFLALVAALLSSADQLAVAQTSTQLQFPGGVETRARENPAPARVRGLNNSLLGIHGQMQRATPNEAALLHGQAASVIEERAAALSALIQQDARQGLSFAFSPELLADLAAKFPESAGLLESHGTWQGPVEHWIIDNSDLKSSRSVLRMKVGQQNLEVHFAGPEPAGLKSVALLKATGVQVGYLLAAASGTVIAPTTTTATTTATCSTTGVQNTAVLMVNFPGVTPPSYLTRQSVYDAFFGTTGRSLDGYWRGGSYGETSAAGDVFGWYTLSSSYNCTNFDALRDEAITLAANAGVNFQNYPRVFIVAPDFGCGWAGLARIGCATLNSPTGSFSGSESYINGTNWMYSTEDATKMAAHEGGHNLGLNHSNSRSFGTEALGPLGTAGTVTTYGDGFSAMTNGSLGHYTAPHKVEELNWLNPANYQIVQSSGTYTLQPLEAIPAGLQALTGLRGTGNEGQV